MNQTESAGHEIKEGERTAHELSDEELAIQLEHQNRTAVGYLSDEVAAKQDDNLDRYLGQPYGDEEEGSSNAVSMDIAEVVDWAMPDLMEPFISGDRIVEFEPATQKDEAWVDQATDLVNHQFFADNPGVIVLHDTLKTGCIQRIGVIKTTWEDADKVTRQKLTGLPIISVQMLQQDQSINIVDLSSEPVNQAMLDPNTAQAFVDGKVYTVELERTKRFGTNKLYSIPPEQFKVSHRVDRLDTAEYCCHEVEKRRYELLDMGFDPDKVAQCKDVKNKDILRDIKRFPDELRNETTGPNPASDLLTLCEEYLRVDANGDGRAELVQVFRVGRVILSREEVEENPFDTWSADRIPNRLIGLGLADKVKQTQKIKTHLTRQMLDNVYLSNNPRIEIPDQAASENTIEDLLTYRVGGLIRTKQPGMMKPLEVPDRSGVALQAIQYMDMVREQQSGITKNGMSIGSEAIDPKSATEARKEDRNEQSRKRLMTRMIAETLLVPVFRKMIKNVVKYQDFERTLKLRGKWVAMDPRSWHADLSAKASAGLGHASKEEEQQGVMNLLAVQEKAVNYGLTDNKRMFNAAARLVKACGFKSPEQFFLDPDSPEGQQAQQNLANRPDPKMAEVQGKQQLAQAQMQGKMQMQAIDMQSKQQIALAQQKFDMQKAFLEQQTKAAFDQGKAQADMQAQMVKLNLEHQAEMQKIAAETQMAREKMAAEYELARDQMRMEGEITREKNHMMAKVASSKASMGGGVRMGGKVG